MRFKHRQSGSQLPEIELTPMLNVMMGILAFFVMITMSLTVEQGVNVELPNSDQAPVETDVPEPLIVQLTNQGQPLINQQPVSKAQLNPQLQAYLQSNPKGFVVLQADRQLPYEQVVQMLGEMKQIGGDRVSLAID